MILNTKLLHTFRVLYILTLPFIVLYFVFIWFILLPDNSAQQTTIVELKYYGLQTIIYFGFGIFIFPYMNRRINKKMDRVIYQFKKQGFTASTFEVYSRLNDRYVGWSKDNKQLLFIDININLAMLISDDSLLNVKLVNSTLMFLTNIQECPKFYILVDKKNLDMIEAKLFSIMHRQSSNIGINLGQPY